MVTILPPGKISSATDELPVFNPVQCCPAWKGAEEKVQGVDRNIEI